DNLVINGATGNSSYSGSIQGAGNLVKSGGSVQAFTGTLGYSGLTTVNGGILSLISGVPKVFIVNGGVLQVPYADLGARSFKANPGGTILYQLPVTSGGFLRGSGTHDLSGVSRLEGATIGSDALINLSTPITLRNVTSGGVINSNVPIALDGFLLTSAGHLNLNSA